MNDEPPPFFLGKENLPFAKVEPITIDEQAELSGFLVEHDEVLFVVTEKKFPWCFHPSTKVYFASSINGWQKAMGQAKWELQLEDTPYGRRLVVRLPLAPLLKKRPFSFQLKPLFLKWMKFYKKGEDYDRPQN